MPLVSVVIPLYNKESHIKRAIDSILAQKIQDFEIVIVDDGSTDKSAEVVKGFTDPRIRLFQQENAGVSAARNRGIEEAKADLIAFLDADDEWMPEHLSTLLKLRSKYPEAGAYSTAYFIKKSNRRAYVAPIDKEIPQKPWEGLLASYFKSATQGNPPVTSSTVAVPKIILNEMNGFNTDAWWGEDTDLWGRIALKYPIAFSWDGMGIYHTEASNRACEKTEPVKRNIFVTFALKALRNGEVSPEIETDLLNYIATKEIQTACRNLMAGRSDLAKSNLYNLKINGCKMRLNYYETFLWVHVPSNIFLFLRSLKHKIKNIIIGFRLSEES